MSILTGITLELEEDCHLIDSAKDLINILSKPVTALEFVSATDLSLFEVWSLTLLNFTNDRKNFLLLGENRKTGRLGGNSRFKTEKKVFHEYNFLECLVKSVQQCFKKWYRGENWNKNDYVDYFADRKKQGFPPGKGESRMMKKNFFKDNQENDYLVSATGRHGTIRLRDQWYNLFEIINFSIRGLTNSYKIDTEEIINSYTLKDFKKIIKYIDECKELEQNLAKQTENDVLSLLICTIRYVEIFEELSININVWNYCLRSKGYIPKYIYIGILILLCQCILVTIMVWYCTADFVEIYHNNDFNNRRTHDPLIMITTVVATIISLITSSDMIQSFKNTRPLYLFSLKLFEKHIDPFEATQTVPSESSDGTEYSPEKLPPILHGYKNLMNKNIITMNYYMDMISNLVLPLLIPLLNIYITIFIADTVVDAILNSVALYFIINLDEQLFTLSSQELENYTRDYIGWVIGTIYISHFPVWGNNFKIGVYKCSDVIDNWAMLNALAYKEERDSGRPLSERNAPGRATNYAAATKYIRERTEAIGYGI
jgi:hypothetical protein